jgi:PIN domain nuclease of toxin-antitoxin system
MTSTNPSRISRSTCSAASARQPRSALVLPRSFQGERNGPAAIDSHQNQPFISAASFWEIAIKAGLGKLRLSRPLSEIRTDFVNHGAEIIDVTADHAIAVEHLPPHHHDPFDRLLVAQALAENLTLVSKDDILNLYGVTRLW